MPVLKLNTLWLIIGYAMVAFVVYSSLESAPIEVINFEGSDKVMHMTAYFGLMGWFLQIYHARKAQIILACAFIAILQGLGGVRFFEFYDMLANSTGVLLAWSLVKTPFPQLLQYIESKVLTLD